ncbi:MAG: hypothetical protein ABI743_00645 [bacterium]
MTSTRRAKAAEAPVSPHAPVLSLPPAAVLTYRYELTDFIELFRFKALRDGRVNYYYGHRRSGHFSSELEQIYLTPDGRLNAKQLDILSEADPDQKQLRQRTTSARSISCQLTGIAPEGIRYEFDADAWKRTRHLELPLFQIILQASEPIIQLRNQVRHEIFTPTDKQRARPPADKEQSAMVPSWSFYVAGQDDAKDLVSLLKTIRELMINSTAAA